MCKFLGLSSLKNFLSSFFSYTIYKNLEHIKVSSVMIDAKYLEQITHYYY